jgi:chromosome segregation ATPase
MNHTTGTLMAMALTWRLAGSASRDEHEDNLRTALTEVIQERDEYQQAADKMAMKHKVERDILRAELQHSITRRQEQIASADFAVDSLKTERDTLRQQLAEVTAARKANVSPVTPMKRNKKLFGGDGYPSIFGDFP